MANFVKFSELDSLSAVDFGSSFPLIQNNENYIAPLSAIKESLQLGTLSTQDSDNVSITGGNVSVSSLSLGNASTQGVLTLHDGSGNDIEITTASLMESRTVDFPDASGTLMIGSNNLSDLTSASTARTNLGLGTTDSPTFAGIALSGNITAGLSTINVVVNGTQLMSLAHVGSYKLVSNVAHYFATGIVNAGDCEITNATKGLILKSPDGTRYRVTVSNGGTLTVTAV